MGSQNWQRQRGAIGLWKCCRYFNKVSNSYDIFCWNKFLLNISNFRKEEEIGLDNYKQVEVPEDVADKFVKEDQEYLKDLL